MASKDLKDSNSELEAGLLTNHSGDDSPKQLDAYAAPPPKQVSPAKRRKTLACHAILIFLVFYIVGFMVTSKSGLSFTSCGHNDSLESLVDSQDDMPADMDMPDNTTAELGEDLSADSSSDENLVPPTLVVIERRQDEGNSTTSPSSSVPAESSTSPSSTPVESSTSEESSSTPAPTSSSSEAESTSATPSSSSEAPEPSTSSSRPPPTTTSRTTQSEETSESSSTEEPSSSSESTSSEEPSSSSQIRHTYTTTLPGGEPTTVIETTWVGVAPSAQVTGDSDPDLQGSSSHLYNRADLALVLAAGIGLFMVA